MLVNYFIMNKKKKIPEPTVIRLPVYLTCLSDLNENGVAIVSSGQIASKTGIKASQFRKDMSYFGEFGIQGLGYPVTHLMERIKTILRIHNINEVVLVGVGNLGRALTRFPGFSKWGFRIKYLFDKDPEKIGKEFLGHTIRDIDKLQGTLDVSMGIITVPAEMAQIVANRLIDAGIQAILNFSGVKVKTPKGVVSRNVDLSHELSILCYYLDDAQKNL